MNNSTIRPNTVKFISKILKPLVDEGVIMVPEGNLIIKNLKHLASKGTLAPVVTPRLIDQKEAAEMLTIGHSNFKRLEKEGVFPFQRRMVGSAVRYRITDIIDYINSDN